VIDGYADLDPDGRPGLGAHVHAEFGMPVIGVAKSRFRTATHAVPVQRGSSVRPLFITAAGMPAAEGKVPGHRARQDGFDAFLRFRCPAPVRGMGGR